MLRQIASLCVVGAVLVLVVPAAVAQGPSQRDQARAVKQRTALADTGRFAPRVYYARHGRERCRGVKVERYEENLFGGDLFSYYSQVDWCWNRRRVTRVDRRRWAEVHYPIWDFKGHVARSKDWGPRRHWYSTYTQGKFQACAGEFGCWQTKLPWIDITVRRGGGYDYDTGG